MIDELLTALDSGRELPTAEEARRSSGRRTSSCCTITADGFWSCRKRKACRRNSRFPGGVRGRDLTARRPVSWGNILWQEVQPERIAPRERSQQKRGGAAMPSIEV